MAKIELRGMNELRGKLKKNANLNDVKAVVRMNGAEMHRKALKNVPVDTGELKRSTNLYPKDRGFTAHLSAGAHYAPYVEYGTRYQRGKPFIRPAFHEQKGRFISDMKRLMK
ncbi:HK97-gp10 family putative phage morphogenesis protein [Shouchella lonarensis]|uniref:Phage protein, HK97 gp10 family n=1 Tax=Shouchella lonarensis TaxID=1464122 RepID=A0A1G6HQE0_9BACI|nr:HK97-gp10 family putative phage morphogenesis protein [Shouchella lonarensis]SDB96411.1 phage protein, HK97 gp10 family [Shouchella lonarensis]